MSAEDQYQLGIDLAEGANGTAKDDVKAFKYLLLAAENGHLHAMVVVAGRYSDGVGVEKDAQSALRWLNAAADAGSSVAQLFLGEWYETGENGLSIDLRRARELYGKAAAQGDVDAAEALTRLGTAASANVASAAAAVADRKS